jgi:hypothetical protein
LILPRTLPAQPNNKHDEAQQPQSTPSNPFCGARQEECRYCQPALRLSSRSASSWGKYVVQAKRYNNLVDVSAVRDLYGTMLNEGAARGILVTTSKYGRDAFDFASNKQITLIDGQNLLALLAKHGYRFKIELVWVWTRREGK